MNEFEDAILPDDFESDLPQSEEIAEETPVSEEVDTTETEQTEEQKEEARHEALQALRVKYNKEEMEIPIDEAIPLVQKGLNYDKTLERLQQLESDPRLSFVEQLASEQGLSPDEFIEHYREFKEQERLNELIQQNIPEEMARELMETKKFREQIQQEKQQQAEKEKETAELGEFFDYFKQANDRDYDPKKDQIPDEVLEARANGVPLKYAFMEHHNQQLRNQIKILKQNESNKQKAPVNGISTHGSHEAASTDPFLAGFESI